MPQKMQLKVLLSDAEKVVTISDGGLFLDVSSIQMFDANEAPVVDSGAVVTVGVSADGLSYQSKVASSNASLGGFEFKHIKVSVSGRTTASTVVVDVKVCSISEAMTSDSYKSRLAGLFTATPYTAATLPDPASLPVGQVINVGGVAISKTSEAGVLQNPDNMKIPSSGTVCLVGCSVTQMNQIGAGLYGNTRQCDFGWGNWLAHYLGGFDIVQNTAKGGASSGPLPFDPLNNVITQLPTALAFNTDWIWMDFGILNDVQRGCTVEQSLAYVDQILVMVAGRNVIAINSTPLGVGHTWATAERMAYMAQVNAGIADRCKKYRNVILIDAFSAIVNPVTGYAKTGLLQTDDNIHYNQNTCRAIAGVGKSTVSGKVVIVDAKFPASQLDAYNATSNPKRAQTNPKLIGSGGSILSGFTGPVPTGCSISKAGTSFTGTSAVDTVNGGWTVTVTGCGAANDMLFLSLVSATDGWAVPGDKLRGGFKLSLSGASNLLSMKPQISATIDGVTKGISTCLEPDNADGTHVQSSIDLSDMSITIRLPEATVPAGVITNVKMSLFAQFSSTSAAAAFKFTDAWLEKA